MPTQDHKCIQAKLGIDFAREQKIDNATQESLAVRVEKVEQEREERQQRNHMLAFTVQDIRSALDRSAQNTPIHYYHLWNLAFFIIMLVSRCITEHSATTAPTSSLLLKLYIT
jgi:hypothetical protein